MTTAREGRVPELTLGWRLKIALGNMKRDEMAQHLGVDPATISRWCADKGAPPKRVYIVQWAMATNVNLDWLEHGLTTGGPTPPGVGSDDREAALARLAARKRPHNRAGRSSGEYLGRAA